MRLGQAIVYLVSLIILNSEALHAQTATPYNEPPVSNAVIINQIRNHSQSKITTNRESEFFVVTGGSVSDRGTYVCPTSDGGYIIAADTYYQTVGNSDIVAIKVDAEGDVQWAQNIGCSGFDSSTCIQELTEGGYILTGKTKSFGGDHYHVLLTKFDSSGNPLWSITTGDSRGGVGVNVQQTTDAGYILTGNAFYGASSVGVLLLRFDGAGVPLWARRIVANATSTQGKAVVQTADGGFVLAGHFIVDSLVQGLLMKVDGSGDLLWARRIVTGYGFELKSLKQTTDGGFIAVGTQSEDESYSAVLTVRLNASGSVQWARTAGGPGHQIGNDVVQTNDGGYAVVGYSDSFGTESNNILLLKYSTAGVLLWARVAGSVMWSNGVVLSQAYDGGLIITGTCSTIFPQRIVILKTDVNGMVPDCREVVSCSPDADQIGVYTSSTSVALYTPTLDTTPGSFSTSSVSLTSVNFCDTSYTATPSPQSTMTSIPPTETALPLTPTDIPTMSPFPSATPILIDTPTSTPPSTPSMVPSETITWTPVVATATPPLTETPSQQASCTQTPPTVVVPTAGRAATLLCLFVISLIIRGFVFRSLSIRLRKPKLHTS